MGRGTALAAEGNQARAKKLTGGHQVIDHEHSLPLADGVRLHLEAILAILLPERGLHRLAGELAGLPDRHEAGAQPERQAGPEHESAGV